MLRSRYLYLLVLALTLLLPPISDAQDESQIADALALVKGRAKDVSSEERIIAAEQIAELLAKASDVDLKKNADELFSAVKNKTTDPAVRTAVLRALQKIWLEARSRMGADSEPVVDASSWWKSLRSVCESEPLSIQNIIDTAKESHRDDENVLGEAVELAVLLAPNLSKAEQNSLLKILEKRDAESKVLRHLPEMSDSFILNIALRHAANKVIVLARTQPGSPSPSLPSDKAADEVARIAAVLFDPKSGTTPRRRVVEFIEDMGVAATPLIDEIVEVLSPPGRVPTPRHQPIDLNSAVLRRDLLLALAAIGFSGISDRQQLDALEEDLLAILAYERRDDLRVAAAKSLQAFLDSHPENAEELYERYAKTLRAIDAQQLPSLHAESTPLLDLQAQIFSMAAVSVEAIQQHEAMQVLSDLVVKLGERDGKTAALICQSALHALGVLGLNGSEEFNKKVVDAVQFVQTKSKEYDVRQAASDVIKILGVDKS